MSARLLMLLHDSCPRTVRVAAQIRAAVDAGFEVDVVALRGPGEASEETVEGARVYRLPVSHVRGRGAFGVVREYFSFTLLAALKAAPLAWRRRYSVVQVHNPPDFLMLAAFVPRVCGARIVLDVHDRGPDMFQMRFGNRPGAKLVERLLRRVERVALRAADSVVTVHEPYRQELIRQGAPPERVEVVMNTLDERVLPDEPVQRDAGSFLVVYHGTVTPHYGVHLLPEAVSEAARDVSEIRAEVYGDGDALSAVIARANELELGERFWVSPFYLPQREVLARVGRGSVGVVPNLPIPLNRFALSTKLFDYVALGVPVVCADLPTMRRYFSDKEVTFFMAGD
jgi:glycosyltransferase involved in cell wall biosynthesis